ncbi:SDR family NAD(P)-dependent oxidoreductase [Prosthecodimorpha staleyi]|uniref:SDR family oxidoreductase n=1 Tax=Prosthecodimorpha staleyi TaxID=2840188 RepID=A0A947D8U9_9HYPH|nr:SDR family NAD(P)-dependent oxidoreductase [Prosthecodimorpha staleyi]MBT9293265.1 SDR family oxidoreductase [Prosthecodimorpha staleyi]
MPTRYDFEGQVAVVTGGAQGIGRAVVERLLTDGARVAIWDLDVELAAETAAELGGDTDILPVKVDIGDYASVEAARDATVAKFGQVDILVNNAGIAGTNAKLWDYPVDEWNRIFRINTAGTFHCCKALAPLMIARNYGRIANVASIAGKEGNPNASAYSASKAAVIALTKSLGKELADYDIAVNCLTPAAARTAIFSQMSEEHIAFMLSKIPRGRFVAVEEVAATIAFMVSRECSFTTGAVFDVSGGRATY